MENEDDQVKPIIQADENSIAIGEFRIDGNAGDIRIGHTIGYTSEQVSLIIKQISTTFQPKPFDGRCPYKGLDVFEEEDAGLFFGREELVKQLVSRVKQSRAVFITGPSGSGKSSLVRAGLIHSLKTSIADSLNSDCWKYATFKPGREPLEALALVFSRLKTPDLADYFRKHVNEISILNACAESVLSDRQDERFVLFIDQFEEVFTQIKKEEEREEFLKVLTDAIAVENGRVIVLFAMRSDFISNCATYPRLNALLNKQFVQIGAMQPEELVSAISQPALRVDLQIDPRLVAQIINDMQGEPGSLPLMQFALKDLFDARQAQGGVIALTLEDYLKRGGIRKALERHADDSFNKLDGREQELARSIFSGLIEVGRGTQDTRRTAHFDELVPSTAKVDEVETILRKLADARLITTDEVGGKDTATISHEKLIDAWPWLKRLVNENRDVIALQNEIAEDALEWENHNRDASYLYVGGRLINTQEKLAAQKLVLSGKALEFVNTGIKKRRNARLLIAAGMMVIIASLITATLIFQKQKTAAIRSELVAQANEHLAKLNADKAEEQARIAFSRQLAAQATLIQNDKRDLALLLSAEAYTLNNDFETRGSMLSALQCCSDALISFLPGHSDSVWDVAFSPDGKLLASGGNDGSIIIWDVASRQQIRHITSRDSTATIYALAFDPNGDILAAGDGAGTITFFHTKDWSKIPLKLRGHSSSILSLKFSRDGTLLASGGSDGKIVIWDGTRYAPLEILVGPKSWVWDVAISPDNHTLAAVGKDRILRLWDLTPNNTTPVMEVKTVGLVSAAFNNNNDIPLLLTGDTNGNVIIWDMHPWQLNHETPIASSGKETGPGSTKSVWGLAFIPGQNFTFITGRDTGILNRNRIIMTDVFSEISLKPEMLGVTGNNLGVFRIDISPDGKTIAAAGQDGLVSMWNATETSSVIRHSSSLTSLQIKKNEAPLTISMDNNGIIQYWDYAGKRIKTILKLDTKEVLHSAISADGTRAITGYKDGTLIWWNSQNGEKLATLSNHSAPITDLAYSPDGKHFASSDENGNVTLWEQTAKENIKLSASFAVPNKSAIYVLLFSKDGSMLIGGGCGYPITFPSPDCSQGKIFVWDVHNDLHLLSELPGKAGFVWSSALNPANPDELAVGTRDGTITIWNLISRTSRLSFRLGKSDITALAFSPDGNLLAVGADGYKVFIYSAQTGQVYGQAFREHDGSVIALAFTPDGNSLLSASIDGTIVIHNINPQDWFSHACRVANRNLSHAEWEEYIGDALPYQPVCPDLPFEP